MQGDAAALRRRAFRDHDDAEPGTPLVAIADALGHLVEVVRNLRHQDHVGAARHAGVQRDPARVAAHHLDDHDAAMRFGRRVQPIDRVGREAHRGVEAETARGPDDVVVDRLRDADERDPLLVELVRDRECSVAADAHERIEAGLLEHLHDAIGVIEGPLRRRDGFRKRIAAVDRAEDRAAEPEDARSRRAA